MLYYLYELEEVFSPLRLFRYITFRGIGGFATGFFGGLILVGLVISIMKKRRLLEPMRDFGGLKDSTKRYTPSMGGLGIVGAILLSALMWCKPVSIIGILALAGALFCGLGALDDLLKLKKGSSEAALSMLVKLCLQAVIALGICALLFSELSSPLSQDTRLRLYLPFVKGGLYIGLGYYVFGIFYLWLTVNSVNVTDGMDGLAIVPGALCALVYAVFAYASGHSKFADYLFLPHIVDGGEVAIFCAALLGAGLAFLWFNAYPATIFMGDSGSVAIGGMLGVVGLLIKQELLFVLAGGIFVAELVSVFVQYTIGLKLLGRRILFRAPFHYSLLHRGVGESKVTIRLWIVAVILAMVALASIKVR